MTAESRCVCTVSLCLVATLLMCGALHAQIAAPAQPQRANSTDKLRPTPSALAAKAGSAITWQTSYKHAAQLSRETKRPIFWYVPTLTDSFMDRQTELDRYMKAGMFSWPQIVDLIHSEFVPLRAIPDAQQAKQFSLQPFKFIEPGFVVVDAAGEQMQTVDRLTTQHPMVLYRLLTDALDRIGNIEVDYLAHPYNTWLDQPWQLFAQAKYERCLQAISQLPLERTEAAVAVEIQVLRGMAQFRLGKQALAKRTWRSAAAKFSNEPLAWKAAAESEGLGPFVRGFEVHRESPAAMAFDQQKRTSSSRAVAGAFSVGEVRQRGVEFLLGMQDEGGGFLDCDYDFGGTDSLPNVHVAVTSIGGMALLAAKQRGIDGVDAAQLGDAVQKARAFVLNEANWNRFDTDEQFWGHAYRVRFFAALAKNEPTDDYLQQLEQATRKLAAAQLPSGSWYHEYPNPFVTALALVALKEASEAGCPVNAKVVERGVASLKRNRGRGGFHYSDAMSMPARFRQRDLSEGSAGRLPLCELGLHCWDQSKDAALAHAVRVSFKKQSHLLASLKYDDHTSRHGYGGFFFWFDLHGRHDAIARMSERNEREAFQKRVHDLVLSLPEIDGCFIDSHEIGRCYGTAMALLCLED